MQKNKKSVTATRPISHNKTAKIKKVHYFVAHRRNVNMPMK